MKVLITGGHLTPALGLIDYIQEFHPKDEIIFVGREYAQEKNKQPSKERTETEVRDVQFIAFTSGKFVDRNPISVLISAFQSLSGFFDACKILLRHKPSIIVSFGSYVAVPVAFAAWVLRIPVITHEQTRILGIANKWIVTVAKALAVSYSEMAENSTKKNVIFTGNVLRKQLIQKTPTQPSWITFKPEKPLLYITGGSQGSEVINTVIAQSLATVLKDWFVIHQCGSDSATRSYKQELENAREQLKPQLRFSYIIREWISVEELAWIYKHATALISRAGANTTQEIALFKIPAILIPLPFSHNNEQLLNAQWLQETGGALIMHQKDLTPEGITEALLLLKARHKAFSRKLEQTEIPLNADEKLYNLAKKYARS